MPLTEALNPSLSRLRLYESLDNEVQMPPVDLSLENSLGLSLFDDSERNCSSFCKEMDVMLCGKTDRQQTESQLSCCSEPRSLTSPNFSLQVEDFSLDQGVPIPINGFPLHEEQVPLPVQAPAEKENSQHSEYSGISSKNIIITDALEGLSDVKSITDQLQGSSKEVGLKRSLEENVFTPDLLSPNPDHELQSLPSIPSLMGNSCSEFDMHQAQGVSTLLSVDASIVGAPGEIKFQRNFSGIKIVFPPMTGDKTIKFDDLINLFSLSDVRQAFCTDNNEEDIIQQLIQQGLGNEGNVGSGRMSAMSHTSSLDLPNSLLSPLSSVCDSWSWEISQLLSGDENSNHGNENDNRSELNTPVVTFPAAKQSDHWNFNDSHQVLLPSSISIHTPVQSLSDSFSMPNNLQVAGTKMITSSSNSSVNITQRVFTPLQVQIPEESDTSVKLSRTLHSCNTYFDELSLGISPVLDLDPNVATVRVSCTPSENSEQSICSKEFSVSPTIQSAVQQQHRLDEPSNDELGKNASDDVDCDMKEISVDIIIDNGKKNWLKLLPDRTDEFIKTISYKCFECRICSKSFRYRFQIQRHVKTNHSTEKPFICSVCGATFSIKYYLTRHLKLHNPEEKFRCKVCPREFNRKYQLVEHELSHKGPPTLKCSDCRKKFNSKHAFDRHRSFCSGNLQLYVCDICGKSFRGISALSHHRVRHDPLKKFKCSMCNSSFHTQWQLVKHTKRHALQGLYVCKFCSLAFNTTSNLKKHQSKCPAISSHKNAILEKQKESLS